MQILYLECAMGAAGDMLAGALLELIHDREEFLKTLNSAGIPGVVMTADSYTSHGVSGTRFCVKVHGIEEHCHEHESDDGANRHESARSHAETGHNRNHRTLPAIHSIIDNLNLPECVKDDVRKVYQSIAEAESAVHGLPVDQIHFHEVGALDAVADITAVCLLMHRLSPVRVIASPVRVGFGAVCCAHGILPVPAPATARLLTNIPVYAGEIRGELCTPTGAALLKYFVDAFEQMPEFCPQAIGYGMGTREYDQPNCVRAFWGACHDAPDSVCELRCNLDDMTPEAIGFAMERLLMEGALDVWTQAIGMKKCRPGVMLCCLCHSSEREKFISLLFCHTTTLGIREIPVKRTVLSRQLRTVETSYGSVHVKSAVFNGIIREKPEYDDLARIAQEQGIPFSEAVSLFQKQE